MRISDGANGCANAVDTQHDIATKPHTSIAGAGHEPLEQPFIGSSMDKINRLAASQSMRATTR